MRLHFIDREGRGEIQKECKGKLCEKLVGGKTAKKDVTKNSWKSGQLKIFIPTLRYKAKYILNSVGGKS